MRGRVVVVYANANNTNRFATKFLLQMNSYHQSIDDQIGKYQLSHIIDLEIDKAGQSLIVGFCNSEVFRYSSTGAVNKIK